MSLTDNVADFLTSMEGTVDDLELCIGPVLDKVRSQTNSPLGSRDTSPIRLKNRSPSPSSKSKTPSPQLIDVEEEDDEFMDPMEQTELNDVPQRLPKRKDTPAIQQHPVIANGYKRQPGETATRLTNGYPVNKQQTDSVSQVLQKAIESLRRDLTEASDKIAAVEARQKKVSLRSRQLFGNLSPSTIAFIIVWPLCAHFLLNRISSRKSLT